MLAHLRRQMDMFPISGAGRWPGGVLGLVFGCLPVLSTGTVEILRLTFDVGRNFVPKIKRVFQLSSARLAVLARRGWPDFHVTR